MCMDYLDFLVQTLNCDYLSDLRYHSITGREAKDLLALDLDMFSLDDYQEAARYLIDREKRYPSAEAARKAVVEQLTHMGRRR